MIHEDYKIEDIDDLLIESKYTVVDEDSNKKDSNSKVIDISSKEIIEEIDDNKDEEVTPDVEESKEKIKIIYEDSSNEEDTVVIKNQYIEDEQSEEEFHSDEDTGKEESKFNRFGYLLKCYRKNPNTFKGTIIGIILSILILTIGPLKTLLIFLVVSIANIIGQVLDGKPWTRAIIERVLDRFR